MLKSQFFAVVLVTFLTACAAPENPVSSSPASISNADSAIAAVKARFPAVTQIEKTPKGTIGASTNITALDRADGWDLVFWEGWGDCPAGCINNRYYYFSVKQDGSVAQVGEYARVFNADKNSFDLTGAPMWSVPK
ncbi:MAG TPA: hypothetical protein VF429_08815 [Anaerolineae bacterium]